MFQRLYPLLVVLLLLTAHLAGAQPGAQPLKMEPRFIDLPEMTVAGVAIYTTAEAGKFGELWDKFHPVAAASAGLERGTYAYGVELYPPSFKEQREFTYMATYQVADSRQVGLHLVTRTLPASKYAVFTVLGGPKSLKAAFKAIYSEWLPKSNYETAHAFDLERYDVRPQAATAGVMPVEILLPVKAKP